MAPQNKSHAQLIEALAEDLTPVQRPRSPYAYAAIWLAVVAFASGLFALLVDMSAVAAQLSAHPDVWLAMTGAGLTAVLGAIAAFQLSLPDRRPLWALLPVPGLVLWLTFSGLGCLRSVTEIGLSYQLFSELQVCLSFIVGMSLPLSGLVILLLRRGYSLRPGLTGLSAGIAVAGASVTLLNIIHPHDPTVIGIAVHAVAMLLVVSANKLAGGRIFAAAT